MKKTAGIFLKVQKILSIIELIAFALAGLIMFIIGLVGIIGGAVAAQGEGEAAEAGKAAMAAGAGTLGGGITFICLIVLPILGLVFTKIAKKALDESKTREEARKGAIFGIVAGVITELLFGIAAGILMLVMKDEDYAGQEAVQAQPAEQPEVIEQKEEVVE